MFRKRWMARVGAGELQERMPEVQAAAAAAGFDLQLAGSHHRGGEESVLLYLDRGAEDRAGALCVQLDLNPPWGAGAQGVLVWSRRREEVVQAAAWLTDLVQPEPTAPAELPGESGLFDMGLRQVGHVYAPPILALLGEALAAPEPELREAAARVIGIMRIDTALPELVDALEHEEQPELVGLFEAALEALTGDAPDLRWLPGEFEALAAELMAALPERVELSVEEPGRLAWGGEPPYKGFELRAYPELGGVTLEVFPCPEWLSEPLPAGLPEDERSLAADLICDPRYDPERYAAIAAALAAGEDPSGILLAAEEATHRAQTWLLRPLAEAAPSLAPELRARLEELLALPLYLPDLALTPPVLLAGAQVVP